MKSEDDDDDFTDFNDLEIEEENHTKHIEGAQTGNSKQDSKPAEVIEDNDLGSPQQVDTHKRALPDSQTNTLGS